MPRAATSTRNEMQDASDGALLLLLVERIYGAERAAAVVAACARLIAERERELTPDYEPERDTEPSNAFWCECDKASRRPNAFSQLCTVCERLIPTAKD